MQVEVIRARGDLFKFKGEAYGRRQAGRRGRVRRHGGGDPADDRDPSDRHRRSRRHSWRDDVEIGPFCIVGAGRRPWATRVRLLSHVVVEGVHRDRARTAIVHPFAVLGGAPQHLGHKGEPTRLVIGARNIIREQVTMHTGTAAGPRRDPRSAPTASSWSGCHVAHDCIGRRPRGAGQRRHPGRPRDRRRLRVRGRPGRRAPVHAASAAIAFIGGLAAVTKDVIPFGSVWGNHAHLEGLNLVGLKRRGLHARDHQRPARRLPPAVRRRRHLPGAAGGRGAEPSPPRPR